MKSTEMDLINPIVTESDKLSWDSIKYFSSLKKQKHILIFFGQGRIIFHRYSVLEINISNCNLIITFFPTPESQRRAYILWLQTSKKIICLSFLLTIIINKY